MIKRIYSLLHIFLHKRVEMRREALFFTVFFLSAAVVWLIVAAVIVITARHGIVDYHTVARYIPDMVRSALLAVPLAVIGGIVFDLYLRGEK